MEVHPIIECGDKPSRGLWYVISADNPPEPRAGPACVARTKNICGSDEILAIGGANPSSTYSDVFKLDLKTLQWKNTDCKGLRSRYEHCAFTPESFPQLVYVFGGASKSGNLNCLQVYNTDNNTWSVVSFEGTSPSPRTIHCGAGSGDDLFVWGGGHLGSDPVTDPQLHVFNAVSKTWSQHDLQGEIPAPRHGHVIVVIGNALYIHGGISGTNFFDDFFKIDLSDFRCSKIQATGDVPSARAAHCACAYQSRIYISGGMCLDGALDDMYCYDTISSSWTSLKFDCPPPAPRLDHSLLIVLLPVRKDALEIFQTTSSENGAGEISEENKEPNAHQNGTSAPNIVPVDIWQGTVAGDHADMQNLSLKDGGDNASVVSKPEKETSHNLEKENQVSDGEYTYVPVCMVLGGLDTSGNLFNDVLITVIDDSIP